MKRDLDRMTNQSLEAELAEPDLPTLGRPGRMCVLQGRINANHGYSRMTPIINVLIRTPITAA